MARKTQAEKVQEAAEYVESAAARIFEEYESEAVVDDAPPPETTGEASGSIDVMDIPALREAAMQASIYDAMASADTASQEAAALMEAARQDWNKVFFMIKALKPRMATDEALRASKLGALLNKLP